MAIMRRSRGELEPVQAPPAPVPAGALDGYAGLDVEEWLEARPPANSKIGEKWANLITPARHAARGFLWLTYTWVRFSVALGLVLAIIVVITLRLNA